MRQVFRCRLFAAALVLLAAACSGPVETGAHGEDLVRFYRMQASFTHLDSGEPVEFDYVVACGGILMEAWHTTPTQFFTRTPLAMFMAAPNGEAVALRTVDMCEDWLWEEGRVPYDLLPMLLHYPDVEDLGFAIAYRSDDAYRSPYAKFAFNGASVTPATRDDWRAWRRHARREYEQIGGLPGPHGYSWEWEPDDGAAAAHRNRSGTIAGRFSESGTCCAGRVRLSDAVRAILAPFAAEVEQQSPSERFWVIPPSGVRQALIDAGPVFDGHEFYDYDFPESVLRSIGMRTSTGGGRVDDRNRGRPMYQPIFPVLPAARARGDEAYDLEGGEVYVRRLLTAPEWQGFGFYGDVEVDRQKLEDWAAGRVRELALGEVPPVWFRDYEGRGRSEFNIYIDDELVAVDWWRHANQNIMILDREGWLYLHAFEGPTR
ncbi:hypothetical protein [Maricaulis sp.]|uniref:hypothetical protein n=1 Tax=Maricaulis sp. TaxID=1486257 RepID=UPI003299645C